MSEKRKVIVVGGGPSGLVAAIAAARNGAETLLIEQSNCLGGMATSGLLCLLGPFDDGDRRLDLERGKRIEKGLPLTEEMKVGKRIIKGIPEEVLNRLIKMKGAVDRKYGFTPINPESLKYLANEMVAESGVKIVFHTFAVDILVEKNRIIGVVVASKSGLEKIYADIVIDATGDGDISAWAGAPFEKGRSEDKRMEPMTMAFRLGGVDAERYKWKGNFAYTEFIKMAKEKGEISFPLRGIGSANYVPGMKGVIAVNMVSIPDMDATNRESLTIAETKGRKMVKECANFFKKYMKGCEDCYLLDTAIQVGVRETRHIIGEYLLTGEDILTARKFSDVIGKNAYAIDHHLEPIKGWGKEENELKPGTSYDIPYRCLIPKRIDNLLVAGRCLSATHDAHGSIRIMPCCMVTGQAAGTAAALSIKEKKSPQDLDISLLQKILKEQNVYLGQRYGGKYV